MIKNQCCDILILHVQKGISLREREGGREKVGFEGVKNLALVDQFQRTNP